MMGGVVAADVRGDLHKRKTEPGPGLTRMASHVSERAPKRCWNLRDQPEAEPGVRSNSSNQHGEACGQTA